MGATRSVSAKDEAPGAGTVQITFIGFYSNEPVEIDISKKKTTITLNTGPAVPAISDSVNINIGGKTGSLTIRFPKQKLTKTVDLNLRSGQYLYVGAEKNSVSLEQASQPRSFD